jgi:glycosyltransferase involved in cell wall biosynthesis
MKILQLCIRFPPAPGGAENHVYHISRELIKRGHELQVFTSDLYTEVPFIRMEDPAQSFRGIRVRRFKSYSLKGEMHYVFIPSMMKALLKQKPDLIHTHSYGYFQTNLGAFTKWMKGLPFVITPHFHPHWSMWGGMKRKKLRRIYDRAFSRPVLNAADMIIGVSGHEMELMKETSFNKRNIRIIPNGIDFKTFEPIPEKETFRKRYGISGEMILYTGRLASNKGLMHLMDAVPNVISQFKDTTFVFIGEDEGQRGLLEERAKKLGVHDKVVFTGHIKDEKLFRSAYSACDVFVLPSEYEAFGIVLLEAMASEKPCVATDVGGVPEVIEDGKTGLLVKYGSSDQLAKAIIELLGDEKKRKDMGRMGRQRVKDNFTWPIIVDKLEKVYKDVLKDH